MKISDQEKEDLFDEFILRMAKMSKEEKSIRGCKNKSAMKHLLKIWNKEERRLLASDEMPSRYGIYRGYISLRQTIPLIVSLKKYNLGGADTRKTCPQTGTLDPDDEWDVKEADKAGTYLIRAMIDYFLDNESQQSHRP